jgi:bifunctional DNA-binding transcriptional regulator/antitoxin component of YhaV-PrlF toxin-antitoxin module
MLKKLNLFKEGCFLAASKISTVKRLEPNGRLLIPVDIRNTLSWDENTDLLVYLDDTGKVIVETFTGYLIPCSICGKNAKRFQLPQDGHVCDFCKKKYGGRK